MDQLCDELTNWQLFEFFPTDITDFCSENDNNNHSNTDELANLDLFFSTFAIEICKLNLLEKNTDCILKLCSSLVKKVNELNKLLISDSQNLLPLQVN